MSFTEVMNYGNGVDTMSGAGVLARTADIFQRLGPDRRENTDAIVAGALSVVCGSFSVYTTLDSRLRPSVRSVAGLLPKGLDRALDQPDTCFSSLPESEGGVALFSAGNDPLLADFGIQVLMGAPAGRRPSGMLWVGDTAPRSFTFDEIQALRCLAGGLAAQSVPDRVQGEDNLADMSRKVAHDLNNILAGLVSYPELMLMQLDDNSPLKTPLAFIHESGQMASDIVQDFLFLVRPRSHDAPVIDPVPVVQAYFAGSAHAGLKAAYPGLQFSCRADQADWRIRISELLLTRVITTLVHHSAQNAPKGSRVDLTLSGQPRGRGETEGFVRIRISDSGPGIAPDHLPNLFDPYYAKNKLGRSGSGIDLAVLKRTVLDHDGRIEVHSPGDRGNVMDVFLPFVVT